MEWIKENVPQVSDQIDTGDMIGGEQPPADPNAAIPAPAPAAPAPVAVVAVPQTLFTEPTTTETNPTA
jgi:hypothetical protein